MPHLKLFSLFFSALLLVSSAASAADISADGAKQLQQRLTQEISSRKDIRFAGSHADFKGTVTVEPKETYYQVSLPSLKLTDSKKNTLDAGKIVMNMVPGDNENEWKSSFALPASLTYTDATGKNSGVLALGTQKASGIWDMDMFGFRKMEASYGGIAYRDTKTKEGVAIADLDAKYDFAKTDGDFSGPVNVTANRIDHIDAGGQKSPLATSLKTDTQITAAKGSANGFTQSSHVEAAGLGDAVKLINQKLKDPNQTGKAQLQKMLGVLSILQISGKPVDGNQDASGYDVITDAQGRTTLNGIDVSVLLGATK